MPKVFTSKTQKIGELGEEIACKFLMKHGFMIKERNYTKKWGELDIVAEKSGRIYFVEVKSVSMDLSTSPRPSPFQGEGEKVSPETQGDYRHEDNMHPWKLKRLSRVIQTYLLQFGAGEQEWQLDLAIVYLDIKQRIARVRMVKDIIL